MAKYIIRRVLGMIPMLILISIILFTMIQLVPGDPLSQGLNPNEDQEYIEKLRVEFGLDKHPVEQYFLWAKNFATGDLGISFRTKGEVASEIGDRVGNTVFLGVTALIITYSIAVPLGILSANRPYSKLDYTVTGLSFVGYSFPSFFLGLLLIFGFSFQLDWFPMNGTETVASGYEGLDYLIDRLHHVVLPAFTLAVISTASYTRYVRASVMDAKAQDFTRTAFAKGLSTKVVMRKHVLRNALIPLVTLFGLDLGALLGGAIITETIFTYPGLGQLFLDSVANRDYPVIMALSMITSTAVLFGNLIADILYAFVDPRIKYE